MERRIINNRYRLEQRLGEGGMGVVFKAIELSTDHPVAIKIAGLSSYHESSARFQREAQAIVGLKHPNIVQVHETGEDSGLSFIVMEYLSGKSLRELIPLDVPEALAIAIQVGQALEYAHEHGIIHRDIKPENLMVLPDAAGGSERLVKVMDFGLARRLDEQYGLTESGMLIGTAAYISPEQALGQRIDARSDLYSLGAVLFEMLIGQGPFPGDSVVAILYQHLNEPPPPPRRLNPRIPVSLEQVILRLLRKEPSERYDSAADLVALLQTIQNELALELPPVANPVYMVDNPAIVAGPPLVGHETEFANVRESIQRVRAGYGQMVLVAGEPGIGKTRLAHEALAYARLHRFQILSSSCYEQEESFPYQSFVDALRSYATKSTWQDIDVLRHSVQGYGGELVALVPDMARIYGETLPPVKLMDPEQDKARLFEAIRYLIVSLSQISPVVIFFDDLQWADATSLQLLHYIVRRTLDQRILVLATYRDTEISPHLAEFLTVVGREKSYRSVKLSNLSSEQSAKLVRALLGFGGISHQLQERIYAETEGNPFFIVETIQQMVEEGLLAARDGEWQLPLAEPPRISATVREVIERRLARLPGGIREILAVGAVIGREFSFSLLKEVSGADDEDLLQTLDRGLTSGLIRERQKRKDEHYDFSHALIREVIYTSLTAARRRLLHQRVGETLEVRGVQQRGVALGELAYHFSHGSDAAKAIEYGYSAGKQAAAVYATEEAYRYLESAREMAEEEGREEHLADILESLGQMAIILGRFDRAVDSFSQAIKLLELHRPPPIARLTKLRGETSTAYERLGGYDEAFRELEHGLATTQGQETVESAYLYGQLAVIYNRRGDLDQAMQFAERDLAIAEGLADEEEVAQACTILYKVHSLRGNKESALQFVERALAIWKKRNDVYRQEWNYLNRGTTLLALGRWEEAEENWHKALETSRTIRYAQGIVQNTLNLGHVSLRRGELAQAESLFTEASALAQETGHRFYVARSNMRTAELRLQQGDADAATALFTQAECILRELGHKSGLSELLWVMADAYANAGQLDSAETAAEEAIGLAPDPGGYEEIGNASRILAKVARKKGDRQRARELLERSMDCLAKLGDSYAQAQAKAEFAIFLGGGSTTDRAEALALLREALADFRLLKAEPDVIRVEGLLRDSQGANGGMAGKAGRKV